MFCLWLSQHIKSTRFGLCFSYVKQFSSLLIFHLSYLNPIYTAISSSILRFSPIIHNMPNWFIFFRNYVQDRWCSQSLSDSIQEKMGNSTLLCFEILHLFSARLLADMWKYLRRYLQIFFCTLKNNSIFNIPWVGWAMHFLSFLLINISRA